MNTRQKKITYGTLGSNHLAAAHDLTGTLGWPHRLADWQLVHSTARSFGAWIDQRLVGTALWWPYGVRHGTLGMVVVSAAVQRQGIGRKLMTLVLDDAGARDLCLVSTPAGLSLYSSLGFQPIGETVQYQGTPVYSSPGASTTIRKATSLDHRAIVDFETKLLGVSRSAVIESLLAVGRAHVLVEANEILGFGIARSFGKGAVIGPVGAVDETRAVDLVNSLVSSTHTRVDIPACRLGLDRAIRHLGLPRASTGVLMARGNCDGHWPRRTFALANQAQC